MEGQQRLLRALSRAWACRAQGFAQKSFICTRSVPSWPQSSHWHQQRSHNTSTKPKGSVDPKEARKFADLATEWWHPSGPFAPLHRLNSARCKFIRTAVCAMHGLDPDVREPFLGLRFLDVGCGGGILAESMARLGATTHGIDITEENVQVARAHALIDPLVSSRVKYDCIPLESLIPPAHDQSQDPAQQAPQHPISQQQYDVVLASEVVEHVRRPDLFVQNLAQAVAPGGTLIMSTISRTPEAYAVAILGAEYITRIVPARTHDWHKFITPQELYLMANQAQLSLAHAAGMALHKGSFVLTDNLDVNYIAAFHKPIAPV